MSGPSNLFVNAYMYAVNKVAYKVMGKGGITISRLATDDLIEFLREKGVLSDRRAQGGIRRGTATGIRSVPLSVQMNVAAAFFSP